MLTYSEALKIAKENKGDINLFKEYENAFVFGSTNDAGFGGASPIVIDRRNGEALMYAYALGDGLVSGVAINEGNVS